MRLLRLAARTVRLMKTETAGGSKNMEICATDPFFGREAAVPAGFTHKFCYRARFSLLRFRSLSGWGWERDLGDLLLLCTGLSNELSNEL